MAGLRHFQQSLRTVTLAADERTRELMDKIAALEAQNFERALQVRQLEADNADLLGRLESHAPKVAEAIRTRNEAVRKLEHAHKVIQNLLGGQVRASASSEVVCSRASRTWEAVCG